MLGYAPNTTTALDEPVPAPAAAPRAPTVAELTVEPDPVTGPVPTRAEKDAAAERLAACPDRDVAAARTLTARLGQLAAAEPTIAQDLTGWLAVVVDQAAAGHDGCTVVGCPRCLYLADARATAHAWRTT